MRVASLLLLLALSHQLDASRVRRQDGLDYGDGYDDNAGPECRCEGKFHCYCVLKKQCLQNGSINYFGSGSLGDRANLIVDICPDKNHACCSDILGPEVPASEPPPSSTTEPPTPSSPTEPPTPTSTTKFPPPSTTTELPPPSSTTAPPPLTCGVKGPRTSIDLEITDTEFGEFPWMLAVYWKNGSEWMFKCGASLVGKNIGLTAAHCVNNSQGNLENLKVRAGIWNLAGDSDGHKYQELQVAGISVHREYLESTLWNDIALIRTRGNFQRRRTVNVVCLPPKGFTFPAGTRCMVTGWGQNKHGSAGKLQSTLRQIEVPLMPHDECQKRLRRTYLGRFYHLHESFMCAGGESKTDSCQGDGGGPLVCETKGQYFQTGIVSWGIGCGVKKLPGVYVDVSRYSDWIKEIYRSYS